MLPRCGLLASVGKVLREVGVRNAHTKGSTFLGNPLSVCPSLMTLYILQWCFFFFFAYIAFLPSEV